MPNKTTRICSIPECGRAIGSHGARGWCPMHYKRWKKNGDPLSLHFVARGASDEERLLHYIANSDDPHACWDWQGARDSGGYGHVSGSGTRTPRVASRVAYQTWVGPIPDGHLICHKCDNPPCVNPAHLFAAPPVGNTRDMLTKQRGAHGERHHWHRLSDDQVHQIRYLAAQGVQQRPIARLIGCSQSQVSNIVRGTQRRHDTNWTPKPELVEWVARNARRGESSAAA